MILNDEDPVVSSYGEPPSGAQVVRYRRDAAAPRGSRRGRRLDRGGGRAAPRRSPVRGTAVTRPGRPDPAARTRSACRAGTASATCSPRSRRGALRRRPGRDPAGGRRLPRRRASPGAGRASRTASATSTTRRAPSRTRSSRRCAAFPRPLVLIGGGRAKDLAIDALAHGRRGACRRRGAHRRERPELGEAFRRRASATPSAPRTWQQAVAQADSLARARLAARRRRDRPARCCSARPPPASTCIVDYAARGRAFSEAVASTARAAKGASLMQWRSPQTNPRSRRLPPPRCCRAPTIAASPRRGQTSVPSATDAARTRLRRAQDDHAAAGADPDVPGGPPVGVSTGGQRCATVASCRGPGARAPRAGLPDPHRRPSRSPRSAS